MDFLTPEGDHIQRQIWRQNKSHNSWRYGKFQKHPSFHVGATNNRNHGPVKRRRTRCKEEAGIVLKTSFYHDSSCRHTVTHYGHFLDEPNNLHHNIPNAQNCQSFIVVLNIVIISEANKPVDGIFYEMYPSIMRNKT